MLTVGIYINGGLIMARSAVNKLQKNKKGQTKYVTDAGQVIWHHYEEGVVALAMKLLMSIKEQK